MNSELENIIHEEEMRTSAEEAGVLEEAEAHEEGEQIIDAHGEEAGHVAHETSLAPEPVFYIGKFEITNSLVNAWISVALLVVFAVIIGRKVKQVPRGLQNFFEFILEGALGVMDGVTHSRAKSMKFLPLVFSLFIFILVNNWLGLIPGVGTIGYTVMHSGHQVFVPYLRGSTADLNTTLALALIAVFAANIIGAVVVGVWTYTNKFIRINDLLEIPKKIRKQPTIAIINPIQFFVGLIEIISEIAKIFSLSFRLFGNVFAGEVLLASIAALIAFVVPVPFYFLEILVGVIQALIFSMLTLVYLTVATMEDAH